MRREFRYDFTISIKRAVLAVAIGFYFGVLFRLLGWIT